MYVVHVSPVRIVSLASSLLHFHAKIGSELSELSCPMYASQGRPSLRLVSPALAYNAWMPTRLMTKSALTTKYASCARLGPSRMRNPSAIARCSAGPTGLTGICLREPVTGRLIPSTPQSWHAVIRSACSAGWKTQKWTGKIRDRSIGATPTREGSVSTTFKLLGQVPAGTTRPAICATVECAFDCCCWFWSLLQLVSNLEQKLFMFLQVI